MDKVDLDELQKTDSWIGILKKYDVLHKIIAELKAAREYIEASKNIDWTWHDPEHCSYDDSSEGYDDACDCGALAIEKSLNKYLRVTNEKS